MTTEMPHDQDHTDPALEGQPVVAEVRDRIEGKRLAGRRRHTWRVILALTVSAVLLLLAVGLRRDQARRKLVLNDLREVAHTLDRWVHEQGVLTGHPALPRDLQDVFGESMPSINERFEYASPEKRHLAVRGEMPVALIVPREPVKLTLGGAGRPVLLCQKASFQVKWFTEEELVRQRQKEDHKVAVRRRTSDIRAEP